MGRLLVLVALALAGCGSQSSVPSTSVPPQQSVEPTAESSIELPLDPGVLGVTCGEGLIFHPSLLGVAGHAETDSDAAADALRAVIVESGDLPRSGWIRVAQPADDVQFLAPGPGRQGWSYVGFKLRVGAWTLDRSGSCQPEVVLPAGVTRAEWRLDPAFPSPAPGDRLVRILINERACTGGQSPEGRVLAPIVASSPTAMTIVILVTDLPGGHDCPGNPDFPMAVELPEPHGGRTLLDGAVFPPRDVSQPAG